jgi:hypothetical protein
MVDGDKQRIEASMRRCDRGHIIDSQERPAACIRHRRVARQLPMRHERVVAADAQESAVEVEKQRGCDQAAAVPGEFS